LKLLDFGIAKLAVASSGSKPSAQTQFGAVMGTLWYMSPEQLRDTAQVTDRTDVYALGIVLYQLVAGRVPFVADSEVELMAAHLRDVPKELRELRPEVPEFVAQLVQAMLLKDPAARPSMNEVASTLGGGVLGTGGVRLSVGEGRPTPRSIPPVPPTVAHQGSPSALSPWASSWRTPISIQSRRSVPRRASRSPGPLVCAGTDWRSCRRGRCWE
jgi:serine/threonine protein kinase